MKNLISFTRINRERIISAIMLIVIFVGIIFLSSLFSGCDNKKTPGLEGFDIIKLPTECKLYILSVDAIKNNDGGGLVKNKGAEKNFTLASFFANPCLNAIKEMKSDEKQKLKDIINNLKTENKELKMKLKFLKEKIESQ